MDLRSPPPVRTYRTSLSLPCDLATGISRLSKHMSISQSALVTALLAEVVPQLESLIALKPVDGDQDGLMRFRGASIDLIMDRVKSVMKEI